MESCTRHDNMFLDARLLCLRLGGWASSSHYIGRKRNQHNCQFDRSRHVDLASYVELDNKTRDQHDDVVGKRHHQHPDTE